MEAEGSLPHSKKPATRSYPEPDRSSACPHSSSPVPVLHILIYPPIYAWVFQTISLPKVFPPNTLARQGFVKKTYTKSTQIRQKWYYVTKWRTSSLKLFYITSIGTGLLECVHSVCFRNNHQSKIMKISSVGSRVIIHGQTDRQTNRYDEFGRHF
jgi:hypothetical protein